MADIEKELQTQLQHALNEKHPVQIIGGNSKAFYGREPRGTALHTNQHSGIITYEPTELFITARAGTLLSEVTNVLADQNQMLGFEPPAFADTATLGGCVATGLSGPRRPYSGAARDFILGCMIINGKADILKFGGEVMKNVAGYDVSRLMCGALGTLGVLLEISLKVLPKPETELTLCQEIDIASALTKMNQWSQQGAPLSACCYDGSQLIFRISGSQTLVNAAKNRLGGDILADNNFWLKINEHKHPFFHSEKPLWRLSLAPAAPPIDLPGKQFIDWGGAQRWLISDADQQLINESLTKRGGHATLFRGGDRRSNVFQPLNPALLKLHQNLKLAFDPENILNPGRLYPTI